METSRGAMLPWRSSCDSCLVARAFFVFRHTEASWNRRRCWLGNGV